MAETAYRTATAEYAAVSEVTSARVPPANAPMLKPDAHARLK